MNIFDLNTYDYVLPSNLIAGRLSSKRDNSRMLVVDTHKGELDKNFLFRDLVNWLDDNYVIVRNNTRVFPARLIVLKKGMGTMLEMLFVKHIEGKKWEVLCKRAKKARLGDIFCYSHLGKIHEFRICDLSSDGMRVVDCGMEKKEFLQFLELAGLIPLPPYIEKDLHTDYKTDYQTIFAKDTGSVAAPTAGFHFTRELDQKLLNKGVQIEEVTLHVGPGTFMPVRTDDIRQHKMHLEQMELDETVIEKLNQAKKSGKKILAVGTTTTRFLESLADENGWLQNHGKTAVDTDLFIYPGYEFKFVDELITNFHLPKSTLLMLVAGFVYDQGNFERETEAVDWLKMVYNIAIREKYRFYSFGDAMLIK